MELHNTSSEFARNIDIASIQFNLTQERGVDSPPEWGAGKILLAVFMIAISLTTVLGNSFVLFLFFRCKKWLRAPSHFLLANLAVADFFVGLIVMPILATLTLFQFRWFFGDTLCFLFDFIHFMLCATSLLSMIAVSTERYIGVKYPLEHRKLLTKRKLACAVVGVWVLSCALTWTPLIVWPMKRTPGSVICPMNFRVEVSFFVCTVYYFVPVVMSLAIYGMIYRTVLQALDPKLDARIEDKKKLIASRAKQVSLAKKMLIPISILVFMFGPLFFMFFFRATESSLYNFHVLFYFGWFRYMNSTVNPFVFALAVPGYKKAFYEIFPSMKRNKQGIEKGENSKQTEVSHTSNTSL